MLNPVFTTRRVEGLRDGIGLQIDRLIDGIIGRGSCDLYRDLVAIFPMSVAADLLGVEASRHADFRRWTGEFITAQLTSNREQEQVVRAKVR
jgi:cytochrome P450